jgi:hypothetical protein
MLHHFKENHCALIFEKIIIVVLAFLISSCSENLFGFGFSEMAPVPIHADEPLVKNTEPMLMINDEFEPLVSPRYIQLKRDIYDCKGMIAPWVQQMLIDEFNFLAKRSKLQQMIDPVCVMYLEKDLGPKTGRFSVHFYENETELEKCSTNLRCKLQRARNVVLVLKNEKVYRSYFLSDFVNEKYFLYCVNPKGELIGNNTCYTLDVKSK